MPQAAIGALQSVRMVPESSRGRLEAFVRMRGSWSAPVVALFLWCTLHGSSPPRNASTAWWDLVPIPPA